MEKKTAPTAKNISFFLASEKYFVSLQRYKNSNNENRLPQ